MKTFMFTLALVISLTPAACQATPVADGNPNPAGAAPETSRLATYAKSEGFYLNDGVWQKDFNEFSLFLEDDGGFYYVGGVAQSNASDSSLDDLAERQADALAALIYDQDFSDAMLESLSADVDDYLSIPDLSKTYVHDFEGRVYAIDLSNEDGLMSVLFSFEK